MGFKFPTSIILRKWLPVVLWLAFIFVMSTSGFSADNTYSVVRPVLRHLFPWLTPHQDIIVHKIIRKGAHAFEYFVLGLFLLHALQAGSRREWTWKLSLVALIGVAVWALGDEFHQSFVLTREASVRDVAIDIGGGLLAQCVIAFWYRYVAR
jgi:VanZ family protein